MREAKREGETERGIGEFIGTFGGTARREILGSVVVSKRPHS
jgi:hypothetical protein